MIKFERKWSMPSKWTFTIKPITELLAEEVDDREWVDPFAGENSPAQITNDINPERPTTHHMDALEFLQTFSDESVEGVLYDPPYSVRQLSECYKSIGRAVTGETTRSDFWTRIKNEIARITKPNAKVISFGWNSGGIGKTNGFEIQRILLVPHGGIHNDTIVTVETKK